MAKSHKKSSPSQESTQELVTVAFAQEMEQAEHYKAILKENDIAAVIKESQRTPNAKTFAVMVAEDFLDEAHVIIESEDAYRDFCEYALEDEQDNFFDEAFDDDEF